MYEIGNYVRFRKDGEIGQLNRNKYCSHNLQHVYVILEKDHKEYTLKPLDDRFSSYSFTDVHQMQIQPVSSDIKFENIKVGQYIKTFSNRQYQVTKIENYLIWARDSMQQGGTFSMITGREMYRDDAIQKVLEPEELLIGFIAYGTIREYDSNNLYFKHQKTGQELVIPKNFFKSEKQVWQKKSTYENMEEILKLQAQKKNK